MVDTINPNTNEPDNLAGSQATPPPPAPQDRFYGGFDKPDETKINLADTTQPAEGQPVSSVQPPVVPQASAPISPQPVQDVNPIQPAEVKHTTYVNTADAINWRGVMVIALIGLVATVLVGAGVYFGVGAMNKSKLAELEAREASVEKELSDLSSSPSPLELPDTEEPTTPEPTPAPTVETPVITPTPIVIPEAQVPDDINNKAELG